MSGERWTRERAKSSAPGSFIPVIYTTHSSHLAPSGNCEIDTSFRPTRCSTIPDIRGIEWNFRLRIGYSDIQKSEWNYERGERERERLERLEGWISLIEFHCFEVERRTRLKFVWSSNSSSQEFVCEWEINFTIDQSLPPSFLPSSLVFFANLCSKSTFEIPLIIIPRLIFNSFLYSLPLPFPRPTFNANVIGKCLKFLAFRGYDRGVRSLPGKNARFQTAVEIAGSFSRISLLPPLPKLGTCSTTLHYILAFPAR